MVFLLGIDGYTLKKKFSIYSSSYGSIGVHISTRTPSLTQNPVENLIRRLNSLGMGISLEESYVIYNNNNRAPIPALDRTHVQVEGFDLVGEEKLKIALRKYRKGSAPASVLGGSHDLESGIKVSMVWREIANPNSLTGLLGLAERATEEIHSFYN
jgi:hypothetical protein